MKEEPRIPVESERYNQTLQGFYGEFGTGANAQIHFLQTGLNPTKLDKITLISDIKGSECWPVRDLFQREVDTKRVSNFILPYLQSTDKVKFFNPLTLTILPFDGETNQIITEVPSIELSEVEDKHGRWISLERKNFYRFKYLKDHPEYGIVEWSDARVKIVAIDGQHRLSALKRFQKDVASDKTKYSSFMHWTVPIVIFGLRVIDKKLPVGTVLDVIRNIFIIINKEARVPSAARQILLSDDSINNICTQELLQYSHDNDIRESKERSNERLPLLFYDWRGEEEGLKRIHSPAYVKTIEEINDWFTFYLFGEDFSDKQEVALGIQAKDDLHKVFVNKKMDPASADKIRQRFRDFYLPGFACFLENFAPYKSYTTELRKYEKELSEKSDVSRHAFYQLRFGSNTAGDDLQKDIRTIYDEIADNLNKVKDKLIPGMLSLDIGMRGIVYALREFHQYYNKSKGHFVNYVEYCKWVTPIVNDIYGAKWLDMSESNKEIEELLLHITWDHNGTIVNYRLESIEDAWGAMMVILIGAYGKKNTKIPKEAVWNEIWDKYTDTISNSLLKGYKRQVRVKLKEDGIPEHTPEFKQMVKKEAEKRVKRHTEKLQKFVDNL